MAVDAPLLVEVGQATPYPGGLLNVAGKYGWIHDNTDPHLGGGISFVGSPLGVAALAPGLSDVVLGITPGTEKVFDVPVSYENNAFAIYKGILHSPAYKEYETEARLGLELGETFAVEEGVRILVLEKATKIGGLTESIINALALAEQYSAENFGGLGVIHVNRFGAAYLSEHRAVVRNKDDHTLITAQGIPIVNGAGYGTNGPGATVPTGDNFFMYVTGPMHLFRRPTIYNEGYELQTNTQAGLAERIYAAQNEGVAVYLEVDGTI